MSSFDKKGFLTLLKSRAEHLVQGEEQSAKLKTTFDTALKALEDPASREKQEKQVENLMAQARQERMNNQKDGPANTELNELRVTTVENFLLGSSNALSFFAGVNLGPTEEPWIENTTRQEIGVSYIGQDGKARKKTARKNDQGAAVDLYYLGTEDYEYQIRDIYRGDMKSPALANVDMAYDLSQKIDQILWPMVQDLIGNFTLTGTKQNRVYNPHSSVNTANLPTTNLLTPTDADGNARDANDVWDLECFKAILKYVGKWGSNAFRDGELRAATVYIPSLDLFGWLDSVNLDTRENALTRQVFESGYVVNFGGTSLMLVGDNTLDPAAGKAYVRMNKPVGEFFTKTAFDEVFVDDGINNRKQNKETISMTKVIGAGLPTPKKVNVACVQYKAAS